MIIGIYYIIYIHNYICILIDKNDIQSPIVKKYFSADFVCKQLFIPTGFFIM